jgi:D-amino-acid dehydrogenase
MKIAVVGAGIIGACIAHALAKRGASVTLIDRDEPGHGCSYGNSGAISPGSVAPVAMPGVLASVPSMLMDKESPLFLPLGYLPRALPWLMRFVASATPARVDASARKLHAFHAGAVAAHVAFAEEVGVPEVILRKGHLHLYPDEAALAKDASGWKMRKAYGYPFERLDRNGLLELEPRVGERYRIGIHLADHATILNPLRYVQAIVRAFVSSGGKQERGTVDSLTRLVDGRWRLDAHGEFDHAVIAAGAWSTRLLDPLGIRLALESQRGYHVQFPGASETVSRTVILADRKIFVTPMEEGLRVGGTVEIGGLERPPDARRAAILERIVRETFPGLDGIAPTTWMGHRPCMPDSVPVVGPAEGYPGLWLAVGHGHLGMTDSINTAGRIANALLPVHCDPRLKA